MNDTTRGGEVVVVGATGYVGQRLCAHLQERGHRVAGVCKPYASFLLERLGIPYFDAAGSVPGRCFRTVINLAYPTRGPGYTRHRQNQEIMEMIGRLAGQDGRVLHVSSLAVFGYALDIPVTADKVALRADNEYCVSKIAIEHSLCGSLRGQELHIVRLGNVWGPACPNWTVGLLDHLRTGKPVKVRGQSGWSNATDVGNVCSYLEFLLTHPAGPGVNYHHLAEFGATPWATFVQLLAGELGVEPQEATLPPTAGGRVAELRTALRGLRMAGLVRGIMDTRRLGADARAILSRLPEGLLQSLKRLKGTPVFPLEQPLTPDDADFLRVISCQRRFESRTDLRWQPEVTLEESFARVRRWMREAGYV